MRIEIGGHGIIPAEIILINRLRVMAVGAVITLVEPLVGNRRRRFQVFSDFRLRHPLIHHPDRLVVQIAVVIALARQPALDLGLPETRPAMARCDCVAAVGVKIDGLVQKACPSMGIAHLRPARGQDIVERAGRNFGGEERFGRRNVNIHFSGSFGRRHHLELQANAIHDPDLTGFANVDGRRNQGDIAACDALADAAAHLPLRTGGEITAELIIGAPAHRRACHHIFGRCFSEKMLWRDDRDLTSLHIGLINHAAHAAEMVAVAMAIDDGSNRTRAEFLINQSKRSGSRIARRQRVD